MEAAFRKRVHDTARVDRAYKKTRQIMKALNYSALFMYVLVQAVLTIGDPCVVVLSPLP